MSLIPYLQYLVTLPVVIMAVKLYLQPTSEYSYKVVGMTMSNEYWLSLGHLSFPGNNSSRRRLTDCCGMTYQCSIQHKSSKLTIGHIAVHLLVLLFLHKHLGIV